MIFDIPDFFSEKECLDFISLIEKEIPNNPVMKMIPFIFKDESNFLVKKTRNFIKEKINLPVENQEDFLITKYLPNGQYDDHYDSFIIKENSIFNQDFFDCCMNRGGQRAFTFLIYLNDNFEGGSTVFPNLNKKVMPKTGKLVYWENIDSEGETNEYMLHRGSKIVSGEKWVAVIYVRKKKFLKL
jgi:prolyl 4-hydroxylase